jgi:hypothetical protein
MGKDNVPPNYSIEKCCQLRITTLNGGLAWTLKQKLTLKFLAAIPFDYQGRMRRKTPEISIWQPQFLLQRLMIKHYNPQMIYHQNLN